MVKSNTTENASERPPNATNEAATDTDASTSTHQDGTHLTGLPLYSLITSMLLLVFIVTLDISVLATAIPRITDEFHTIADIGWYASAFLIAQCALQPLSGRIYSFFSFKLSFMCFFAIFELGSLLCGVAQSSKMLVVGRAICGIGSAGLINGSLTIIGLAAPPGKRAMMLGIFVSVSGCGQIIGPLIGGALTQHASWRWCFFINLPLGAVTVLGFIFTNLPDARERKSDRSFKTIFLSLDIPGFLVFAPACVMLLLGLEWGGNEYAWKSATIIGLLCGSVCLFTIFGFWEKHHGDRAMIPASLLSIRAVYSSCATAVLQGGALLILTYYLAIWFQVVKHASPTTSAVYTLPNFISQVISSLVVGVLINKIGYLLPPMLFGSMLHTVAYGLCSTFEVGTSARHWIGYQILAGCGRGMSLQMPILAVQASVPKPKIATVSAMVMWSQFFGSGLFLSAAQTIFVHSLKAALHEYVPSLDASVIIDAGATGFASVVPAKFQPGVERAYDKAIAHTFYLGIALAAAAFFTSFGVGALQADLKKAVGEKDAAATDPAEKVEK